MSTSILPSEAAHFGALAADWWDPRGSSAMLHRLNPVRLAYLRARIDAQWDCDPHGRAPLAGRRVLDAGCGAGLLSEPLARMGADVIAMDAAPENIAAAKLHAAGQGLTIDYRAGGIEALGDERFDLIVSMEVIEHVVDPSDFVASLAGLLAPGGLIILSTPNRTNMSRLALVTIAEGVGMVPKGTHDWSKFLKPEELTAMLAGNQIDVIDITGIAPDLRTGFRLGSGAGLNYLITGRRV